MFTNEPPPYAILKIDLDFEEIDDLARLIGMNDLDENRALGNIRLVTRNGRRYWYATDSYVLGRLEGRPDSSELDILLPTRLFIGASTLRSTSNDFELYVNETDNGTRFCTLRGDLGEILGPHIEGNYPPLDELMGEADSRPTDFQIEARLLAEAVNSTGYGWDWLPKVHEDEVPLLAFARSDEGIWVSSRWNVGQATTIFLAGEPAHRTIETTVNAAKFHDILRRFDEEVRISFGQDSTSPIRFSDGQFTALLMPIKQGMELRRRHVESTISEVFGIDALNRDDVGDYQLQAIGVPVWARLMDVSPTTLRVFATVAAEIENSPELLNEINEINAKLTYAKIDWDNNFVTVSSDLVAETVDAEELFTAFSRVRQIGDEMSDVIITRFGGRGINGDAERWANYRNTVVVAELYPESRLYLNGSSAIEDWPFTKEVYVITAHNPLGITRSDEENRSANLDLAMEIARAGGRYCAALGESRDGGHGEAGFATWNLDFDEVLSLARKFRQEAVFRVTTDEFTLIDAADGSITDISQRRT